MEIRVFCFRGPYYYGFGLTPKQAVNEAVKAGLSRKHIAKGDMCKLPRGVTEADVDLYGKLTWKGSEYQVEHSTYNKKHREWVDKP